MQIERGESHCRYVQVLVTMVNERQTQNVHLIKGQEPVALHTDFVLDDPSPGGGGEMPLSVFIYSCRWTNLIS